MRPRSPRKSRMASAALWCCPSRDTTTSDYKTFEHQVLRLIVMATRSLSPKQTLERIQRHRQAVMMFARLAAKRAVQDQLRAQGVRVTLVLPAEIMRQAREYLDTHPELYQQALERAQRMGYADPRCGPI